MQTFKLIVCLSSEANLLETPENDIIITVSKVFHFCIFDNHRNLILKHSTQRVNLIQNKVNSSF